MEIIKFGIPNTVTCDCCHTELRYNKHDLQWTHTEENYYYIKCPVCGAIVWIPGDEKHDKMYKEARDEREGK